MKKLLKSKRGTFIGDIAGVIGTFFQTLPRTLQLIVFLFIILFIGAIIQYSLYFFGIFCYGGGQPVKVHMDILTSITTIPKLIKMSAEASMGNERQVKQGGAVIEAISPYNDCSGKISSAYNLYHAVNGKKGAFIRRVDENESSRYYYFYNKCVTCVGEGGGYIEYIPDSNWSFFEKFTYNFITGGKFTKVCLENAIKKANFTWEEKLNCETFNLGDACYPPTNFFYDWQNNTYNCYKNDCSKVTIESLDDKLRELDATALYPQAYNETIKTYQDYTTSIGIVCPAGTFKPQISIFGVEIFDYKLWFLLGLVSVLFWIYWKIKRA